MKAVTRLERSEASNQDLAQELKSVEPPDIAILAYQYWQERGCPMGCPEDDWFRAERELSSRTASDANSFHSAA